MTQANLNPSTDFGTAIWQTRTVAELLYSLPTLGLIDLSKHPSITIVFVDYYANGDFTADFKCTVDIEEYLSPMYIEALKNSTNRRFSKTNLVYGDVLVMKCKTLKCVHDAACNKYEVNLEVPGLYLAVENANGINGCIKCLEKMEASEHGD